MQKEITKKRSFWLALGFALAAFYVCAALLEGYRLYPDSQSYLDMDLSREPLYSLFLALMRLLFGRGGEPFFLQATVIVMIVFAVVLHLVLKHTAFGRRLLLVGCDENVAKRIGINVDRVKTRALLLEGLLCGFAGSFFWIVVEGAIVTTGLNSYEFLAIAGACLGGISLLGGRGTIFPGAVIGSLILLFLAAGMANAGISIFVTPFVRGVIIFIAMYIDSLRTRRMMGNKLA